MDTAQMQTSPADISQLNEFSELITELGMEDLSRERQEDLILKISEVLLKRIFIETMFRLGEKGMDEYERLANQEDATPEKMEMFFREKILDYDDMVNGVVKNFREEMTKENKNEEIAQIANESDL